MQQCRHWRMRDLERAYDRLLETDLAIKTGKLPDDLALDLLVVELSQRR
jgi:DNA polymerase III delta subunit